MITRLLQAAAGVEIVVLLVLLALLWRQLRQLRRMPRSLAIEAPAPLTLVRAPEFGPLLKPLDEVECLRSAIFRDQMLALTDRWASKGEEFQGAFVEHWASHWSFDYVAWLTS